MYKILHEIYNTAVSVKSTVSSNTKTRTNTIKILKKIKDTPRQNMISRNIPLPAGLLIFGTVYQLQLLLQHQLTALKIDKTNIGKIKIEHTTAAEK